MSRRAAAAVSQALGLDDVQSSAVCSPPKKAASEPELELAREHGLTQIPSPMRRIKKKESRTNMTSTRDIEEEEALKKKRCSAIITRPEEIIVPPSSSSTKGELMPPALRTCGALRHKILIDKQKTMNNPYDIDTLQVSEDAMQIGALSKTEAEYDFAIILKSSRYDESTSTGGEHWSSAVHLQPSTNVRVYYKKNPQQGKIELLKRLNSAGLQTKKLRALNGKQTLIKVKAPQVVLEVVYHYKSFLSSLSSSSSSDFTSCHILIHV
jgi:hypothetical protein